MSSPLYFISSADETEADTFPHTYIQQLEPFMCVCVFIPVRACSVCHMWDVCFFFIIPESNKFQHEPLPSQQHRIRAAMWLNSNSVTMYEMSLVSDARPNVKTFLHPSLRFLISHMFGYWTS